MTGQKLIEDLISAATAAVQNHAAELTKLDQAIGDGDHGTNMTRGFDAIAENKSEISALAFGPALQKAGMTLVMKVGGASGPLYGSLLMSMGKAATTTPATHAELADMLDAGIEAVKKRGRSDTGAKTMLDVLVPVLGTLRTSGNITDIRATAQTALDATRDMLATKGRAAFLGERSIGHIDPGARSSALLINCVCDVLEET